MPKRGYVPGQSTLVDAYQSSDYMIVLVYKRKNGREYRRMVQQGIDSNNAWRHAKQLVKGMGK